MAMGFSTVAPLLSRVAPNKAVGRFSAKSMIAAPATTLAAQIAWSVNWKLGITVGIAAAAITKVIGIITSRIGNRVAAANRARLDRRITEVIAESNAGKVAAEIDAKVKVEKSASKHNMTPRQVLIDVMGLDETQADRVVAVGARLDTLGKGDIELSLIINAVSRQTKDKTYDIGAVLAQIAVWDNKDATIEDFRDSAKAAAYGTTYDAMLGVLAENIASSATSSIRHENPAASAIDKDTVKDALTRVMDILTSPINNFGKRLKHIHMHDNLGGLGVEHDLHLPIGSGNIDFYPIFKRLKEINYSGNITLESQSFCKKHRKISIEKIKELL